MFAPPAREIICQFLEFRDILTLRCCSRTARAALAPKQSMQVWKRLFGGGDEKGTPTSDPILLVATPSGARMVETARQLLKMRAKRALIGHAIASACAHNRPETAQWFIAHISFQDPIAPYVGVHVSPLPRAVVDTYAIALSALEGACANGHVQAAEWVVSHFRLTRMDFISMDFSPLLVAATKGHLAAIEWLVKKFVLTKEVMDQRSTARRAVVNAAKLGHLSIVKWLVTKYEIDRSTILSGALGAALMEGNMRVVKWFSSNYHLGDTVHLFSERVIDTEFQSACGGGKVEAVAWLYEFLGLETCYPLLKKGFTTACVAGHMAGTDHMGVVRWFLAKVTAITNAAITDNECTLFRKVCARGYTDLARLLLHSAKISRRWRRFDQDFEKLCGYGHLSTLQFLVEAFHFDPATIRIGTGNMALTSAAAAGHYEIVKWLVESHSISLDPDMIPAQLWQDRTLDQLRWLRGAGLWTAECPKIAFRQACHRGDTATIKWLTDNQFVLADEIVIALTIAREVRSCDVVHVLRAILNSQRCE